MSKKDDVERIINREICIDFSMIVDKIRSVLFDEDFIVFSILFGSYARGKIFNLSDVDVAIYTNRKLELLEYGYIISELEAELQKEVDLIVLNDLFKKNPSLAFEIMKEGKLIFCKDKEKYLEYKKRTFLYYMDTEYLRRMVHESIIDKISKWDEEHERKNT